MFTQYDFPAGCGTGSCGADGGTAELQISNSNLFAYAIYNAINRDFFIQSYSNANPGGTIENEGPLGVGFLDLSISMPVPASNFSLQYLAQLHVFEASGGTVASGMIDPLISIQAPPGVSVTSASGYNYLTGNIAATPEPSTFFLLGIGLAGLAGWQWRRRIASGAGDGRG